MSAAGFTDFDRHSMSRALELAARGLETTHPNPRVGCVVTRDRRVVGEGWHAFAGEPHAEVLALEAAGEAARGATVYVTLEPCSHHGRTPPCVDALLAARVARVVFALRDPDPRVDGRGAAALRASGIEALGGLMEEEARELNAGFVMRLEQQRPLVRLKLAASLDGRTALASGESRWITSEAAREDVQRWRARSSAVLTGIGTVVADDPRLDVRVPQSPRRQPLRVVLDRQLRISPRARVLAPPGEALIITTSTVDRARREELAAGGGVQIEQIPAAAPASDAGNELRPVMKVLASRQVNELLVEAGPTLAGAFLTQGLVDELLLYLAPSLLGGDARPFARLPSLARLADRQAFELCEHTQVGPDLRLRLRPARARAGS